MSAVVKLSSALPGDFETNGLDALAPKLLDDPQEVRVSVVWHDVVKIIDDVDTGTRVPVTRVRRWEPLGLADEVSAQIRSLVEEAIRKRTGRTPIPWDQVEGTGIDPDQISIDEGE